MPPSRLSCESRGACGLSLHAAGEIFLQQCGCQTTAPSVNVLLTSLPAGVSLLESLPARRRCEIAARSDLQIRTERGNRYPQDVRTRSTRSATSVARFGGQQR